MEIRYNRQCKDQNANAWTELINWSKEKTSLLAHSVLQRFAAHNFSNSQGSSNFHPSYGYLSSLIKSRLKQIKIKKDCETLSAATRVELIILVLFATILLSPISVWAQTINPIPKTSWTLKFVDSEQITCASLSGNWAAVNAFDGNTGTMWHTKWCPSTPPPHEIQINLGGAYNISGFRYLPRQDSSPNGRIGQYEFYVSTDGTNWGSPVATGTFANSAAEKTVSFTTKTGQFVRLRALTEVNGGPWTSMAEINILGGASSTSSTASAPAPPPPSKSQPNDTGTANAPLNPSNLVVKTVCASGCDYSSIQAAVNASAPGWTIQVKDGIYTSKGSTNAYSTLVKISYKNGTAQNPITLMAYPGSNPILDCNGIGNGSTALTNQAGIDIIFSSWWIIDGFEIRGCYWGVSFGVPNVSSVTIRNNKIHHNQGDGILTRVNRDLYIAYNEIYQNGTAEGSGTKGCPSYHRYCHGIYLGGTVGLSKTTACATTSTTVRGNYIHDHHGAGAHIWSNSSCTQTESNILVENNLLVDNLLGGWEISKNYLGNLYINNTVVLVNPPQPGVLSPYSGQYGTLLQIQYATATSPQNQVYNNIFYLGRTSYTLAAINTVNGSSVVVPFYSLIIRDRASQSASILNSNTWYVPYGTAWIGPPNYGYNNNFISQYLGATGYDKQGKCCTVDPLFVNLSGRDFHLQAVSPARNAGSNSLSPPFDIENNTRPQEGVCDMGAYEFTP